MGTTSIDVAIIFRASIVVVATYTIVFTSGLNITRIFGTGIVVVTADMWVVASSFGWT
jgi:hypothetical protein